MKTFNVLCPGPSLEKFESWMLEAGKTIAVNGAIAIMPHADYWALQDWEVYDESYTEQVLFVPSSWTTHRPDIQRNKISYEKGSLGKIVGIDLEIDRYTMTAAIGLAMFCGADRIVIHGADLSGEGYVDGVETNDRTNHTQKRWDDERLLLVQIIDAALARDVSIVRLR